MSKQEWTLATPFIDREHVVRFYLEALKRQLLPRSDMHLCFVDLSKNPKIKEMLEDYIYEYGDDYKSAKIHTPDLVTYVEDTDSNGTPDFQKRREAIADTMNYINNVRKGHLLIWEEDIVPPVDAFIKCADIFKPDCVKGVTAVQYSRRVVWPEYLLLWDYAYKQKYTGTAENKYEWEPVHIQTEKRFGFENVGASATGFILLKEDFLDTYSFTGTEDGQDVMLGRHINGYIGNHIRSSDYLLVRWDVKTVHIGQDKLGRVKFYRSPQCKTGVYSPDGGIF